MSYYYSTSRFYQGRSDREYIGIYTPPQKKNKNKSTQVNFLWGKNDVRTAIQQFYTPKNVYTPPPKKNSGYAPGFYPRKQLHVY